MALTSFDPRPLPAVLAAPLRERLATAHDEEPFSPTDPRAGVRRLLTILAEVEVRGTVYRGGLDLRGAELDHVWVVVPAASGGAVIDVALPLHDPTFVAVLRRYAAGDVGTPEVAEAARGRGIGTRVLGEVPALLRYRGQPVWAERC